MRHVWMVAGLLAGCATHKPPVTFNAPANHPLAAPTATSTLRQAIALVDAGNVVGAEALLRTLIPASANPEDDAMVALEEAVGLIGRGDMDAAGALLRRIVAELPRTRAATTARRLLDEVAVVGRPSGDLDVVRWLQGDATFDAQPVTMVVFWEAWCPHCRNEVPRLQLLADAMVGEGLQVVGVTQMSQDTTDDDIVAFVEAGDVRFPLALEDGSMSERYGVNGVPALAIVAGGEVVWRGHPSLLGPEVLLSALGDTEQP